MKKIFLFVFLLAVSEPLSAAGAVAEPEMVAMKDVTAEEIVVKGRKGDILQRVTGQETGVLNPSRMSVYKAINLLPSLNQQSVDPYGLADIIVNYHESFRFRGVEATAGGVPATIVNVEGVPLTGRPGGGAPIDDLENFSNINIYTGVLPACAGLGLADVGGKITMEIRRTCLRVDTGRMPGEGNIVIPLLRVLSV